MRAARSTRFARTAALLLTWSGALGWPALAWGDAPPEGAAPRAIVAAERAFVLGARPRPQGAVQASVADEDLARWNIGGNGDPNHPSSRAGYHPAPRVLVDVSIRSGSLPKRSKTKSVFSEASLVAQTRNAGYWPFRICYEEGLRRDPALRGKTRVRFVVESNGHVKSERMAFTELKDHAVAKCLSARVRSIRFSPAPPRRVHADTTIDLNPGDAPLPDSVRAETASVTSGDPAGIKMDQGAVTNALEERLGKVTTCYEEALARDPKLWGRVAMLMDVDAEGRVLRAAEYESHFPDPAVPACTVEALRGAVVPPPPLSGAFRLVWGVKLGAPPAAEAATGRAGSAQTPADQKRTVAEAAPPRVPVAK